MRKLHLLSAFLMTFSPVLSFAADGAKCECTKECRENCKKGKGENCKCKHCDCKKTGDCGDHCDRH